MGDVFAWAGAAQGSTGQAAQAASPAGCGRQGQHDWRVGGSGSRQQRQAQASPRLCPPRSGPGCYS